MPQLDQNGTQCPDLVSKTGAGVGWWFVQGSLDLPDGNSRHFMAAFFEVHAPLLSSDSGHMLLAHLITGDGSPVSVISRITSNIATIHEGFAKRVTEANFVFPVSRFVLRHHMQDVVRRARLDGIETLDGPGIVQAVNFGIEWLGFRFEEEGGGFSLVLPLGEREGDLSVSLIPEREWYTGRGAVLDTELSPPYQYACCPRFAVSGTLDGQSVTGRAWFERQWGDFEGWFLDDDGGKVRLLGWDYLSLSLDTGQDILAMRQFAVGGGPIGEGFVLCFDEASVVQVPGRLELDSVGCWTSPRSGIRYPISRRLVLPQMRSNIRVKPVALDQEIPVFGAPSIWEGAVTATGEIDGRQVNGLGRLELFGYGYADTPARFMARQVLRNLSG